MLTVTGAIAGTILLAGVVQVLRQAETGLDLGFITIPGVNRVEMQHVLDRPTPFTLNALRLWPARADNLVAKVAFRDDGTGGVAETAGSGLAGLRDRVTALGGWMHVVSPPGGPTTLTVELPCGS